MSWIEVEAKIKVRDYKSARNRIRKIARFVGRQNKDDKYFSVKNNGYPKKSLRVRDKGNKVEVNFKKWLSYKGGIHAKKEIEFEVSDIKGFFELLRDLGFKEWMRKKKISEVYKTRDKINIELNSVKGLGWYVEIEILCQAKDVNNARKRIKRTMKELGFKKKDIERKGYTKLFWDKRH